MSHLMSITFYMVYIYGLNSPRLGCAIAQTLPVFERSVIERMMVLIVSRKPMFYLPTPGGREETSSSAVRSINVFKMAMCWLQIGLN